MGIPADADDLIAGRYALVDRIGRGGAGEVWRGYDRQLEREVAIKRLVLAPSGAADDGHPTQSRALREARAAARLRHHGAVTIYDVIEDDGTTHLIMEYVEAPDLAEVIARDGPLTPVRTAALGAELLATLRAAHQLGVVHRDVKPSNVLVPADGRPRLTDFGTALLTSDDRLTTSGLVIGSPAYMSPEQAAAGPVDHRTDLWSLGATLYHAVEGVPPFAGGTPLATAHAVTTAPPRPPTQAGPLEPLLLQLLRKDPAERPDGQHAARVLEQVASESFAPAFAGIAAGTGDAAAEPAGRGGDDRVVDVRVTAGAAPVLRRDPQARQRAVATAVLMVIGAGMLFAVWRAIQPADDAGDLAAVPPIPSTVAEAVTPPEVGTLPAPTAVPSTSVAPTVTATTPAVVPPPTSTPPPAPAPAPTPAEPTPTPAPTTPPPEEPEPTEPEPADAAPEFGEGEVPPDWITFDPDHAPYTVQHPPDWAITRRDDTRTDIRDPASATYLRLDWTDDPKPDALEDWLNYEETFGSAHPGYERIRLERTTFKGEPAAIWEYAYETDDGRVHAYNLNVAGQDYGYALNFQTREADWEAHRPLFDAFAGSYTITG